MSRSRENLDILREEIATIVKGQRSNNLLVSNSAMVLEAGGFHKRGAKQATNNLLSVLTAVYQTPTHQKGSIMPPSGRMTESEIQPFLDWIATGAPDN